ncbi:hypothetical protein Tco_1221030 [Tanacetum coccineum]
MCHRGGEIDQDALLKTSRNTVWLRLLAANEQLHKENEHLKQTYKELFDSIKKTKVQNKDNSESLISQINQKSVENADLKAQHSGKGFCKCGIKNELRKIKGNSVDTKFAKASILGKPPLQPSRNHLVVRQPNAFTSERPRISRPRFASQVDEKNDLLSKTVTPHYLPKVRESAASNHLIGTVTDWKGKPSLRSTEVAEESYLPHSDISRTQDFVRAFTRIANPYLSQHSPVLDTLTICQRLRVIAFKLDEKWFTLSADLFRRPIKITPCMTTSCHISSSRPSLVHSSTNSTRKLQQSPHLLPESLIHPLQLRDEDAMDKEVAVKVKDHKRKHDSDDDEDDDDEEWPSACWKQGRSAKRRRPESAASGSAQPPSKDDHQSSKKPRESDASASKQLTSTYTQLYGKSLTLRDDLLTLLMHTLHQNNIQITDNKSRCYAEI